jgi:hypothetical protein
MDTGYQETIIAPTSIQKVRVYAGPRRIRTLAPASRTLRRRRLRPAAGTRRAIWSGCAFKASNHSRVLRGVRRARPSWAIFVGALDGENPKAPDFNKKRPQRARSNAKPTVMPITGKHVCHTLGSHRRYAPAWAKCASAKRTQTPAAASACSLKSKAMSSRTSAPQ